MMEDKRLEEDRHRKKNWKRWGPYLSERQWGTVREDYSADGACWDYLPHDNARSVAYRWGEDGLLGITDRQCRLCLSLALWNGKDPILKERLFGLTGPEGNHGEDVKECYYYLDSTPTHSYMKMLYKYPQSEYPYSLLVEENRKRGLSDPEYELEDTGVFDENRYWDVTAEYAKHTPNDVLCRYTVANRGPEEATLHVIPVLWYRNTWIWGCKHEGCTKKPSIKQHKAGELHCSHETLGQTTFIADKDPSGKLPAILFTENETNYRRLYNVDNYTPYTKDAFHRYIVNGEKDAINHKSRGTKVGMHYMATVKPGEQQTFQVRFFLQSEKPNTNSYFSSESFDKVFAQRMKEADEFYEKAIPNKCPQQRAVARQAYAGLLWSKQFYHYIIKDWLSGDPEMPAPPRERFEGRNKEWGHLFNRDVISMPDKWEYPWYASWDLAFHMLPFAVIDIDFAKDQLLLFLREWYMHPNGQIPAYEFAFGDVNPPVHAWAVRKVYKATGPRGSRDHRFLARCFQKLILNFTWWVNRKDPEGKNLFSGGFLGLDNIGVFDRSKPLPHGGHLEQADGTAWMAFFCVIMLDIALELAEVDPVYEDMASKFFEHFVAIMDAMNKLSGGKGLWDEDDGFYYDQIKFGSKTEILKLRSMVGLVPLFSCLVLEESRIKKLTGFYKRTKWFLENRKDLADQISLMTTETGNKENLLLAIPTKEQLVRVLEYLLDEKEFLSPYGIRSLSKIYEKYPFVMYFDLDEKRVEYAPGESTTVLFGGNSNWRGPIWLCMNYLIVEVLKRYDFFYGDSLKVDFPTGSGNSMRLNSVADKLSERLTRIFLPDEDGRRPCHGNASKYAQDPHWKDLVLFYEYFHAEDGRGCGASHQTGWTALVVDFLRACIPEK